MFLFSNFEHGLKIDCIMHNEIDRSIASSIQDDCEKVFAAKSKMKKREEREYKPFLPFLLIYMEILFNNKNEIKILHFLSFCYFLSIHYSDV